MKFEKEMNEVDERIKKLEEQIKKDENHEGRKSFYGKVIERLIDKNKKRLKLVLEQKEILKKAQKEKKEIKK